ncbi:MAG TPA: CmpA/NrtA family ABC transporter substrate-binding protein [Candidatus Manganitrophaceae bacterium]|nr:CmpA/NrtA family ABC transporter substrate-binding protein [Candidatus Manganitrophaceae bacterium]
MREEEHFGAFGHHSCGTLTLPDPGTPDRPVQNPGPEALLDRAVEEAMVRAVLGQTPLTRRRFIRLMGEGTMAALLAQLLPLEAVKAAVKESGPLEKKALKIGFVPITCATPIIMAGPMGFYSRYGLEVELAKTPGWAVMRDKALAKEYDAEHMLTPMPLAITLGAGSPPVPFVMAAIENINGQAITLHIKHKEKRNPKEWKGFKFAVPFEYSMHNFLLRYYLAEHGLDPDKDVDIRTLPPPEMVANLRVDNLDGYLSPDPFNQRAVFDGVGFIHLLSKEIWDGHPCCAFAASREFVTAMPNTFGALLKSIVDATHFSSKPENRKAIAEAIAPKSYLNQPQPVVEQVLTGTYDDGLGKRQSVPGRIDFNPFPWHSMAVWILTQMKRWGYVKGDLDYKAIAEKVYLASECGEKMKEIGYPPPAATYQNHTIMSKVFDPGKPEEYIKSFNIRKT